MTPTSIKTWTDASRHDPTEHLPNMSHVQAFPYSPARMTLQIRSEGKITGHGSKHWQIISNARLDIDGAMELYAALGKWIKNQPHDETAPAKRVKA